MRVCVTLAALLTFCVAGVAVAQKTPSPLESRLTAKVEGDVSLKENLHIRPVRPE